MRKPRVAGQSRPSPAMAKSTKKSRSALISRAPSGYAEWGFPWFSSVVGRMPGYTIQSRGTARTSPHTRRGGFTWAPGNKSHTPSLRQSQSGLRTQTANQAKFIPPIISPGQPRHYSLAKSFKALRLTSKSLAQAYAPVRVKVSVVEASYAVKRENG